MNTHSLLAIGFMLTVCAACTQNDKTWYGQDKADPNPSYNSSTNMRSSNSAETRVLRLLHSKSVEEIAAGKVAQERGSSAGVRDYGNMLESHHSENDAQVREHAARLGVDLGTSDSSSAAQAARAKFEGIGSDEFDRRFAVMMRDGHREVIQQVESARSSVSDAKLKEFLASTLDTLRKHEQEAARLAGT